MSDGARDGPLDTVLDTILDGRLKLLQRRKGHRAGTDAVLLAAAAAVEPGDVMVDVGAGVGTVGLALALRAGDLAGTLLDADRDVATLAAQNCRLNGVEPRLKVATCDLFDPASRRAAGVLDRMASLVVTNPPFFAGGSVRISPDPGKARAHHLGAGPGDHAGWVRAALALLEPHGRFCAIHRPEALPALLAGCENRLGAIAIMPVHASPENAAIRILLAGRKGSRAPMTLRPPLILHGPDGRFTPDVEALHRGRRLIRMEDRPG